MYISYEKLWKLLLERGLNKTDLISLGGISSRTLSKLSKNQNVNTDTLLAICEALDCGIGDIMEICADDAARSLYSVFVSKKPVSEDEYFKTYEFEYKGKPVIVKKTVEKAGKTTHIRCDGEKLVRVDHIGAGHVSYPIEKPIGNAGFYKKDAVCIVVISGKDMGFRNLDDGVFISWNRPAPEGKHIYLMSEPRFKLFEPVE